MSQHTFIQKTEVVIFRNDKVIEEPYIQESPSFNQLLRNRLVSAGRLQLTTCMVVNGNDR